MVQQLLRDELKRVLTPDGSNFVQESQVSECLVGVPLLVYIQTFIPAFILTVFFSFTLLWDDIVIDSARRASKAFDGPDVRPGKRTKTGRRPVRNTVSPRWRSGRRTVLAVVGIVEVIGFTWLLVMIPSILARKWTGFIQQAQGCGQPPENGPLFRNTVEGEEVLPGEFRGMRYDELLQNEAGWINGDSSVVLPQGVWSVLATRSVELVTQGPLDVEARIIATRFGEIVTEIDIQRVTLRTGTPTDIILQGTVAEIITSGVEVHVEWRSIDPQVPIIKRIDGWFIVEGQAGI